MRTKIVKYILIMSVFICTSCVEEYWPVTDKYDNVLVVDGVITNKPGPYTITLSTTSQISSAVIKPCTNAEIIIYDDDGNSEILSEISPGKYCTATDGIQGIVGRKYMIKIKTQDNMEFSSNYEEIIPSVGIDSVYHKIEYKQISGYTYDLCGLQFYINTEKTIEDTAYFFWRTTSTYEYNSSFLITHIYDHGLSPFYNTDSLYTCWRTDVLGNIYLSNTAGFSKPQIVGFPLNYVSSEDRELSIRYSLLVQQFAITKNIFDFWNSINELNDNQGALFASLPYQIRGNISCDMDENIPVFGYFMAAGVSEKRIFVDRPHIEFHYCECELSSADFERIRWIFLSDPKTWPIYITSSKNGAKAHTHQDCVDCTRKGGSVNKPVFWID